jgi:ATP-dependent Zn protease
MKKLPHLTLALVLLFSSFSLSFAQTDDDFNVILEDEKISAPGQNEPTDTEVKEVPEKTEEETVQEQITAPQQSFWEVLTAILIPCFFIILVYFILKSFKF